MGEVERGEDSGLHIPYCRAKEMHGHALFSKACLGVIHKGTWLVEHCFVDRGEVGGLEGLPE